MSAAKVIKQLMVERDVSVKELSERLGMKTPQLLSNKLYRDTFTYEDYIKIVNMLDCTVQTVTNDTSKVFTNEYNPAASPTKIPDSEPQQAAPKIHKPQFRKFTPEEAAKIDNSKLLTDVGYQVQIVSDFGMDVFNALVDKTRQETGQGVHVACSK